MYTLFLGTYFCKSRPQHPALWECVYVTNWQNSLKILIKVVCWVRCNTGISHPKIYKCTRLLNTDLICCCNTEETTATDTCASIELCRQTNCCVDVLHTHQLFDYWTPARYYDLYWRVGKHVCQSNEINNLPNDCFTGCRWMGGGGRDGTLMFGWTCYANDQTDGQKLGIFEFFKDLLMHLMYNYWNLNKWTFRTNQINPRFKSRQSIEKRHI